MATDDFDRSLTALEQDRTLIAVIEPSLAAWSVGGIVAGIEREPMKKIADEAVNAGQTIQRSAVVFEAGRGFWLARWLRGRGIGAYVIDPTGMPVSRERRRAKSDRLDISLLRRSFLGWVRGEKARRRHRTMAAIDPDTGRRGCETPDARA